MKIEDRIDSNFAILTIEGNIVLEETAKMKAAIEGFVENADLAGIIINCEKVNFIDSSGLGLIVSVYKTLLKRERKFALTALNDRTKEIFILTKLDKILSLTETDAEAVALLKS